MKKRYLFPLSLLPALLLASCSDDEDAVSKEELLKNKRWNITALQVTSPSSIDYYQTFAACQRDNFAQFQEGGVLLMDEGATKCNAPTPQQASGTWSLQGDLLHVEGIEALGIPADKLELTLTDITNTTLTANFTQGGLTGTLRMAVQ
ncbi:hypothetical protein [Rufibacter immobilis]|uniref:hypothetical protein n=1 Tax=Rufibacter immobilis TaxID=1348778 RepID=UPI0035E7ABA4